jgi:WhiB family redox-sensing transcriptional regulator
MAESLCAQVDPELFFPNKGGSTREAKLICKKCPVTAECLDYALEGDARYGVYGGTSERDRRKIKRRLKAEA